MVKGHYLARVCYDEEFKEEMDLFLENIAIDKDLDNLKLKNRNQRFSVAIRELIKWYNGKRSKALLKLAQERETTG